MDSIKPLTTVQGLQISSWKLKIGLLQNLISQIKSKEADCCSFQILECTWIDLIRDSNLNVVQTAVETLKEWVKTFGIRNIRVQRQLLKALLGLTKMGKQTINQSVVSIVTSLYKREKQGGQRIQRAPLGLIDHENFNSSNNPTFLLGSIQSDTIQEVNSAQEQGLFSDSRSASPILNLISEVMQSCRKPSFVVCLRIILALQEEKLLTESQFCDLFSQMQEICSVIEHRRIPHGGSLKNDSKATQEITDLMSEIGRRRI